MSEEKYTKKPNNDFMAAALAFRLMSTRVSTKYKAKTPNSSGLTPKKRKALRKKRKKRRR